MVIEFASNEKLPANNIALASISIDGGTQSRASVDQGVVADYADAMRNGAIFPPIVLFHDGKSYWLADGFHRYHALNATGAQRVIADVRQGTRRDAILFSVGANASHGLRRTNEDKRRAVLTLLQDAEWSTWSDNEISKRVGVSATTVGTVRKSLSNLDSENRTYTTKHGSIATMNTASIGKPVQHSGYETADIPVVANDGTQIVRALAEISLVPDDDEITEEDLANDPGFQKAVEALNSAKALYDEVQAMPAAEPVTAEHAAGLQRAFGTQQDRANIMQVIRATELVKSLPEPSAMAASVPSALDHAVDVIDLLTVSQWFENFARAWERKGASA
ncbi:ParB N-terminal domain-containing protein [Agrobacterium tumefaciens]|uniref:ParB N-terminal domain-containing protein n=1 Tax=Agrobacterium tumefaciens TaxID=358 RepID=UPI003BA3BDB3